jgi:hypothetical protein
VVALNIVIMKLHSNHWRGRYIWIVSNEKQGWPSMISVPF